VKTAFLNVVELNLRLLKIQGFAHVTSETLC